MVTPALINSETLGSAPGSITLPDGTDIDLRCVSATFDGSGAGGSFLACLSVFAASGQLIGRFFPSQTFSAGDSGEVTYAPFLEAATTAAPAGGTSIPTASMQTGHVVLSPAGPGIFTDIIDLSSAPIKTNSAQLSRAQDGSGFWGIQCPGQKLIRYTAWMEMDDLAPDNADGEHSVDATWTISFTSFGPTPTAPQIADYVTSFPPYVSTIFGTAGSYHTQYLQRPIATPFVLGVAHVYKGWTVANIDWQFGIIVEILGDPLS